MNQTLKVALIIGAVMALCCVGTCGVALDNGPDDQSGGRSPATRMAGDSALVGHWYYGVEAVSKYTRDVRDDWQGPGGTGIEYWFMRDGTCAMDSVQSMRVTDSCWSHVIMGSDECRWSHEGDVLTISLGERRVFTRACGSKEMKFNDAAASSITFKVEFEKGLPVLVSEGGSPRFDLRAAP